ncbi:MAG: lysozyme inhibitor LprI family protein [Rhodospirillales bacterium]
MRVLIAVGFLFGLFSGVARAQASLELQACDARARSQAELNKCAEEEVMRADEAMNRAYEALLAKAAKNPVAVKKIKAAQQAWLAFREAHLEAVFPAEDKQAAYGAVQPMCASLLRAELAWERAKVLESMANPEEGDVCSGQRY